MSISLYDPDMLAPRSLVPVFALLTTNPHHDRSLETKDRDTEDDAVREWWYKGAPGPEEPAIWFRQNIIHGLRAYVKGLLHCVSNGVPSELVVPGSELANFLE